MSEKTVEEAAQLRISRTTAKYHLDRAKAQLGVKTNVQAGIALKRKRDD